MMRPPHLLTMSLAALVALAAAAPPLSAQAVAPDLRDTRYTGVGYSASIPSVLTGIAVFHNIPSLGLGVFGNFRYTFDSPERERHFQEDTTVDQAFQFGDLPVGIRDAYAMGMMGVFRPINPDLALYVGVGLAEERSYREFFDESRQRGESGHYWVEVSDARKSGLNLGAGVLIQATRNFSFMGGVESFPLGIAVAGLLAIPW